MTLPPYEPEARTITYDWVTLVLKERFDVKKWEWKKQECFAEARTVIIEKMRRDGLFPGERESYEVLETHVEFTNERTGETFKRSIPGYHPGQSVVAYTVGFRIRVSPHDWGEGKFAPYELLANRSFRVLKMPPPKIYLDKRAY